MKLFAFAALFISLPVLAAQQTTTLAVQGMDCPACPITVKKSLQQVKGVKTAKVDFAKKQATVTYDDALTSPEQLTKATSDAGYPSTVAGPIK